MFLNGLLQMETIDFEFHWCRKDTNIITYSSLNLQFALNVESSGWNSRLLQLTLSYTNLHLQSPNHPLATNVCAFACNLHVLYGERDVKGWLIRSECENEFCEFCSEGASAPKQQTTRKTLAALSANREIWRVIARKAILHSFSIFS